MIESQAKDAGLQILTVRMYVRQPLPPSGMAFQTGLRNEVKDDIMCPKG